MVEVKTYAKGQIVIPKKMRDQLGMKPGSMVSLRIMDDHLEIRPLPDDPIKFLTGIFKDVSVSMTTQLLNERKKDDHEAGSGDI